MRASRTPQLLLTAALAALAIGAADMLAAPAADAGPRTRWVERHQKPGVRRPVRVHRQERQHVRPYIVAPRVRTVSCPYGPVVVRPWHASAPVVFYGGDRYYFHVRLGVHFGGTALAFDLRNRAPAGYTYYDPCSGKEFPTVRAYKRFARRFPDRVRVLTVIPCGLVAGGW